MISAWPSSLSQASKLYRAAGNTKWTGISIRASLSWKLSVVVRNGNKSCIWPRSVCYGKGRGCGMGVILTFCVSRVVCCLGRVGGCASTCWALSEPLWTLSQVKGNGLLLGKVVAGDGNFTFLLFALCLWMIYRVTALRVCTAWPRKSAWRAGEQRDSWGRYSRLLGSTWTRAVRATELSSLLCRGVTVWPSSSHLTSSFFNELPVWRVKYCAGICQSYSACHLVMSAYLWSWKRVVRLHYMYLHGTV